MNNNVKNIKINGVQQNNIPDVGVIFVGQEKFSDVIDSINSGELSYGNIVMTEDVLYGD